MPGAGCTQAGEKRGPMPASCLVQASAQASPCPPRLGPRWGMAASGAGDVLGWGGGDLSSVYYARQVKFKQVQGNKYPNLKLGTVETLLFDLIVWTDYFGKAPISQC